MKMNKAIGWDKIVIGIVSALGDLRTVNVTEVINEIYDNGEKPEELGRSIFLAMPKKPLIK